MFKAIKEKKKDKGSCDYFFLILVKEYELSVPTTYVRVVGGIRKLTIFKCLRTPFNVDSSFTVYQGFRFFFQDWWPKATHGAKKW